jgi:hypothetical protein
MEGEWPAVDLWAEYYVTLLSPDLTRACVDRPLILGERAHALFASAGDTLFALQQRVAEGTPASKPHAEIWVKRVLVGPKGCDWIPIEDPPDVTRVGFLPR